MEALQSGKVPKAYKSIIEQPKKYTAKQAFIEDPKLEKTYKKSMIPRPQTAQVRQAPIQTTKGVAPANLNLQFEPEAMFTSAKMHSPEQMQPISMRQTDVSHELMTEREDITNLVTMLNAKPQA